MDKDRRMSIETISVQFDVSVGYVHTVICEERKMQKIRKKDVMTVFEWHKRLKEGRESVGDDERCGRSKEVNTPKLIGQRVRVRVTMLRF